MFNLRASGFRLSCDFNLLFLCETNLNVALTQFLIGGFTTTLHFFSNFFELRFQFQILWPSVSFVKIGFLIRFYVGRKCLSRIPSLNIRSIFINQTILCVQIINKPIV